MTDETLVLRHPKLLSLYAFWLEQCAGAPLPLASALNPPELRPWLGNLLIMDVASKERMVRVLHPTTSQRTATSAAAGGGDRAAAGA